MVPECFKNNSVLENVFTHTPLSHHCRCRLAHGLAMWEHWQETCAYSSRSWR